MLLPILTIPGFQQPPPRPAAASRLLTDSHGRTIRDLRLSITDKCNFRCIYCMDENVTFARSGTLLTLPEMLRIARICRQLGVTHLRLTGGEPTLHPQLTSIIAGAASLGFTDLAMTTNGSLVTSTACKEWKQAGLHRLTFSLDSVEQNRFAAMTRTPQRFNVSTIIDAISIAANAGLGPIKVNAVIVKGYNEDQIVPLATLARQHNISMRFIEYMPLDSARAWDKDLLVTAAAVREAINSTYPLIPHGLPHPSSTATVYNFADGAPGEIGLIAPVSSPFCGACSRLRITADGKVRPCLFSTQEWDLLHLLRSSITTPDQELEEYLLNCVHTKQSGHGIATPQFTPPARSMSAIGG